MKNFFKNLSGKKDNNGNTKELSGKKKAMREIILTPHAVQPARALRLEKRKKNAEVHSRSKERNLTEQKQIKSTLNYQQRLLEKQKTRQKKERRMAA